MGLAAFEVPLHFSVKDPLNLVYVGCILAGVFYSLIIMLFGQLSHGDGGGGGFHFSDLIGGHGGGDGGGVHTGAVHISFLSPLSITTFTTGFGALGLILKLALNVPPMASIFYAFGGSIVIDVGLNLALYKIFIQSQGSSVVTKADLIGLKAEVITTIPEDGTGEIWYDTKTGREASSARALDKKEIHKGDFVEIKEIIGGVALVKRLE
jgi:membrane protein implicated in regulation of membrane protease activity